MSKALTEYHQRRDFRCTREPTGRGIVAPSGHPRFVIQKHAARRLHYDLRLEIDGVFKSWAVTRGPSLDPKQKRLAVEVEDHPLDYGDFEGPIPKREYGGGTVMIWDRGFWSTESGDPLAAINRGELKFAVAGNKLRGSFVLVRMSGDRTRTQGDNWLLIKHADRWSKLGDEDRILSRDRSVASGRDMSTIAAERGREPEPFIVGGAAKGRRRPRTCRASGLDSVAPDHGKVKGIRISNPDRLVWPEPQVSKIELASYIATVGAWMLPHITDRPCSLLRAPKGTLGEQFFQRHLTVGMPDSIERVSVKGDREPYLRVQTVEALVSLVQFGAVEFHPWNCEPGDPETPGRLVFDIDPAPDLAFERVIEAAKDVRERLLGVGLIPFCKTTGGKGLHVVTPLAGGARLGWHEAKTFAHTICQQMADASPHLYLTSMSKKRRSGRIFLDYLRNERAATAVAPLSPRARAGAIVSMPLSWPQVRKGLDPSRFTVRTAPSLLCKSQAWSNYHNSMRPLDDAIRALLRHDP